LKEMEAKGDQERKDYKKYVEKRKEYLKKLRTHDQWKKHEKRGVHELQINRAQLTEQKMAVEDMKNAKEMELKAAKKEALAKLRACQAARREEEKLNDAMREKAQEDAKFAVGHKITKFDVEAEKRRREFELSLREQEKLGLIRIVPRS
jgi:hypothetical protein